MSKYKPGTLDDYAVMRRRRRATQRQAENANMPTGSNVYETTSKVMQSQAEEIDLQQAVGELAGRLDDLACVIGVMTAPGACVVTDGQPPPLPGTWEAIGTFDVARDDDDDGETATLSIYERIDDDGND